MKDALAKTDDGNAPAPPGSTSNLASPDAIIRRTTAVPDELLAYRRSMKSRRPGNRGFMPPLLDGEPRWPLDEPGDASPQRVKDAADVVAARLAIDGLLATLVRAISILGPDGFASVTPEGLAQLREVGLPIDWLRHFRAGELSGDAAITSAIAVELQHNVDVESLAKRMHSATFAFQPTQTGFAVADDSGGVVPGVLRVQLTRGGYWRGEGDGGTADMLRQVMAAVPSVPVFASVEQRYAGEFQVTASTWPLQSPARLTLVSEPMPVAQWTQDNAKAGVVIGDGGSRLAMLAPRYASSNDDGSVFLPDETFLLPGIAAAIGAQLVHSPLLFQGGNILCVTRPVHGAGSERLLLVSDADVYRNTALGLTVEQTLEAFRVEFGCDRCEMLEAVSFHLDYDLSVRAVGDRVIALVNDPLPAVKVVLEQGMGALVKAGLSDEASAKMAIDALRRDEHRRFLDMVAPIVYGSSASGAFPLSLAERFATSPVDSGVGNLQRYLLALDMLVSQTLPADQLPPDGHARSYLLSMSREDRERDSLNQRLRDLGMEVVPVPSISNALRSIAALNGLQLRGMFIMPAYGGLYAAVDAAAQAAVSRALGDGVRIVPVECSESQRRCGAVRCSLSVFPKLTP